MKTKQVTTIEKSGREVARPLKILVPLINEDIRNGDEAGLPYYRDAGEKLLEAKKGGEIKHGQFENWAEKTFNRKIDSLQTWMRLAKMKKGARASFGKSQSLRSILEPQRLERDRSHRQAYSEILKQVRAAHPEIIEKQLEEEKRSKASKAKLMETRAELGQKLAHKLIKIGYNALANEFHPDKGGNGSHEAMALLNDVASYLRRWADDYQG